MDLNSFLQNHKNLSQFIIPAGAAIAVLAVYLLIRMWKKRRKAREAEWQTACRMREEALDRALRNPLGAPKTPGPRQVRRPFKVDYAQGEKGRQEPGEDRSMYQLTEVNELSERKYMFRRSEQVLIGRQFGSVTILSGPEAAEAAVCRLFSYEKESYVRSTGKEQVLLSRRGKQVIVDTNGLKLRSGDVITVDKTVFQVEMIH